MLKVANKQLQKWVNKLNYFRHLCVKKDRIIEAQAEQIQKIKDFYAD